MATKAFLSNLLILSLFIGGKCDVIFNIENKCSYSIWLGASPSNGDAIVEHGPDTLEVLSMSDPWTGIMFARTTCSSNASLYFSCETGDCRTGQIDCQGPTPNFPVTLLNFGINQGQVSYEVNLNHGFNIPVRFQPDGGSLVVGGSGACPVVDCIQDLKNVCPSPLVATNKNGMYVACNSACDALKDPKFCCTGEFTGPACKPNEHSRRFKDLCKLAHTYPGDNDPPVYKCSGANRYYLTFCPS